jgi:hypothetical protein
MADQSNQQQQDDELEYAFDRDRDQDMAARPLSPGSLCGSYFRAPDQHDSNAEALWLDGHACLTQEGMVVAQPFASSTGVVYLVEFYGRHGMAGYQQLVDIDRMLEQRWLFYDTDAWLTSRPISDQVELKEVRTSDE